PHQLRLRALEGVPRPPSAQRGDARVLATLGTHPGEAGAALPTGGDRSHQHRSPTAALVTPAPTASTTPTSSWPMIRPGSTGYSPRTMCRSVPQIVVRVVRTSASPGP